MIQLLNVSISALVRQGRLLGHLLGMRMLQPPSVIPTSALLPASFGTTMRSPPQALTARVVSVP
jgi:hypothetical protein